MTRAYRLKEGKLLYERGKRGWSQRRAADEAGLNKSLYNRIERGHVDSPQYDTLEKIAEAYGLEVSDIIEPTLVAA